MAIDRSLPCRNKRLKNKCCIATLRDIKFQIIHSNSTTKAPFSKREKRLTFRYCLSTSLARLNRSKVEIRLISNENHPDKWYRRYSFHKPQNSSAKQSQKPPPTPCANRGKEEEKERRKCFRGRRRRRRRRRVVRVFPAAGHVSSHPPRLVSFSSFFLLSSSFFSCFFFFFLLFFLLVQR